MFFYNRRTGRKLSFKEHAELIEEFPSFSFKVQRACFESQCARFKEILKMDRIPDAVKEKVRKQMNFILKTENDAIVISLRRVILDNALIIEKCQLGTKVPKLHKS